MTDQTPSGHRRTPTNQELDDFVPDARRGREARLGIFVIGGLLSFVVVLFMLTSPAALRGRYMIHTIVNDAGGVRKGDPIQMRGVNIGRVNRFEMRPDGNVLMRLEVEGKWGIPIGSSTRLAAAGMFGGRTVEVLPSDAADFHAPDDTIPGEGGSAGGILGSMDGLSDQAGSVMTQIETLLDDQTIGSVQGSARELETLLTSMSGVINEQRGALTELTASLRRSAEGLEGVAAAGPDVASAIARADSIMATLNETSVSLDGTIEGLRSIVDKIDRGEGTLGLLVQDSTLYTNMNASFVQFSELLADLKDNPGKYISLSIF
jgi:phospholipid/cholesterol/gamma-HCH transport system substrate-binding protein